MRSRARVFASAFFPLTLVALFACPAFAENGAPVALDYEPMGTQSASTAASAGAPADVNFGSYPLSVLGIENAIRNADSRVREFASGGRRVDDGPIAYAVVAIRDWEHKYPHDSWIAKDLLALAKFYAHVGTADARERAVHVADWLRHDYPACAYATGAAGVVAELRGERDISNVEKARPPASDVAKHDDAPPEPRRIAKHVTAPAEIPEAIATAHPVARKTPSPAATLPPYAHYAAPEPATPADPWARFQQNPGNR